MGRVYMAIICNLLVYCLIMMFPVEHGSLLALLTLLPSSLFSSVLPVSLLLLLWLFSTTASTSKKLYLPKPVSCIKIRNSLGILKSGNWGLDLTLSSDLHGQEKFAPLNHCSKAGCRPCYIYYSFHVWEFIVVTIAGRNILLKMRALISDTSTKHCGVPAWPKGSLELSLKMGKPLSAFFFSGPCSELGNASFAFLYKPLVQELDKDRKDAWVLILRYLLMKQ